MVTWTIGSLERRVADGFVTTAHWRATATDGEFSGSVYGTSSWGEDAELTTPYESLTEQDVLGWCWANGVDKDAAEASLAAQIEAQKNPVTANGLPWASN